MMMHTEKQITSASSQSCSVACMSLSLMQAVFQTYLLEIYLLCLSPAANTNIISQMKLFFVSPESFWWQFVSNVWLHAQAVIFILRVTVSSVCLSLLSPLSLCVFHRIKCHSSSSRIKIANIFSEMSTMQNTSGALSECVEIFLGAPEGV